VIVERYVYSALAYGGDGNRAFFTGLPAPDVIFYLDREPADALQARVKHNYEQMLPNLPNVIRLSADDPELLQHVLDAKVEISPSTPLRRLWQ
jgi:hypothetical protein